MAWRYGVVITAGMSGKLLAVFLLLFASYASAALPDKTERFPIGAMFNYDKGENSSERIAFNHEMTTIDWAKDRKQRLRASPDYVTVNADDNYDIGSRFCQLMAMGVFAIYSSHTVGSLPTLRSYSRTFQMPVVSTDLALPPAPIRASQPQEPSFEIYVRPLYARALVDIIRHYGWKDIWYLYDCDEGLERLQQLLDALTEDGLNVRQHIYRVLSAEDAFQLLKQFDVKSGDDMPRNVLVDLPVDQCEALLNKTNADTRLIMNHYLIVGLFINDINLGMFLHGGMNITGLCCIIDRGANMRNYTARLINYASYSQKVHLFHRNPNRMTLDAALAVDAATVLRSAIDKVIHNPKLGNLLKKALKDGKVYNNDSEGIDCNADSPGQWGLGPEIIKTMREMEFSGMTGHVMFDENGYRKGYKLDLMEVSTHRGYAKIGQWDSEKPADQRLEIREPSLDRRNKGESAFANRTRIVTSILGPPYLMVKPGTDGSNKTKEYEGYCVDLATMISNLVGFTFEVIPVKDAKYGAKDDKTNQWNGMVGELTRHEADLAIGPLTITAERERVIDFSKPFMSLGISIMIKKPIKDTPSVFSFMNPLSYEIWMCIIFAYIGVSVVLFLVSRFSPFEWHIEDHTDGPSITNNFTIFNSLWFSLGAFMQQGCDIEPRSMSGRIVGSVWWFFTLIIISSYTANLAAFLTVERMQSPIESADDLAKQTEIKYGCVDSGSTKDFFQRSTIPIYERMWAFMSTIKDSAFVATTEIGLERVRTGKYAFLIESTTNDYHNQRKPCDTMKVGSNLDSKGYGIGTPRGSDLRDRITLAVLELAEKEDLAKLEKRWWYEKGECGETTFKKQEATSSLKLPNVAGIFYILLGGLMLALLMAGCEFLYKSKVDAKRRKTTFTKAIRSKARLSITGTAERHSISYAYTPTSQLVSLDGYADTDAQTQV